jgi:hypothetical protein
MILKGGMNKFMRMKLTDNVLYTAIVVYLVLSLVLDNLVSVTFKKYVYIPITVILIVLVVISRVKKWQGKR